MIVQANDYSNITRSGVLLGRISPISDKKKL